MMKQLALDPTRTLLAIAPEQAKWLEATMARSKARFAGFTMMAGADPDGGGGDGGEDPADKGGDLGFPEKTPVREMTAEQQAAYYKHQSNRHEQRNKELLGITGGKYGDDLKAELEELETLRDKTRTDAERAVEEAKKAGRSEGISALSASAARAALEFALGHDPDTNDQSTLLDALDVSKVLTDEGTVDTAKVRALVKQIAPADKEQGNQDPDYGGGRRRSDAVGGVTSGRDLFESRRKKSTSK